MEIVSKGAERLGFGESVAMRIASKVRKSTLQIFKGNWDNFC